jgi:hypothetical protein
MFHLRPARGTPRLSLKLLARFRFPLDRAYLNTDGMRGWRPENHLSCPVMRLYRASGIQSINTSAFVGTNPTGELITSGLPVIRPGSTPSAEIHGSALPAAPQAHD